MRLRFYLVTLSVVIAFVRMSCRKDICLNPQVRKKITVGIQNPQKYYQVGDTIIFDCSFPYSELNDLTNSITPPQRYYAFISYSLIELITNNPNENGQFAGAKFDCFQTNGSPINSLGYVEQQFMMTLTNDSINGVYKGNFLIVPKQTGKYVFDGVGGQMNSFQSNNGADCNRIYSIWYTADWNVPTRNLEIASELALPSQFFVKNFQTPSGFYINNNDGQLFYFYVQ